MVKYSVEFSNKAKKDALLLKKSNLKDKALEIIEILKMNPFQNPPPYEKLIGDLSGYYSRRINIQHRLVYKVYEDTKSVKIRRMWSHYE